MRGAEFLALSNLPGSQKDRMTPIFRLKPYGNAKSLEHSITKIRSSFGDRTYFLDLDPHYIVPDSERQAVKDYADLEDGADSFASWTDYIEDLPNALPCLQSMGQTPDQLVKQANRFSDLGKPFLLKIGRSDGVGPNSTLDRFLDVFQGNDFGILLERGHDRDQLGGAVWATGIAQAIRQRRQSELDCILTGSSFPRDFSEFGGRDPGLIPNVERLLFDQVRTNVPGVKFTYGDWASSRPPAEGGSSRARARIDLAHPGSWSVYRDTQGYPDTMSTEEYRERLAMGYKRAARWARGDRGFLKNVELWGYRQIDATAEGNIGAIQNPYAATAVRINVHLFRQANYYEDDLPTEMDEPFTE